MFWELETIDTRVQLIEFRMREKKKKQTQVNLRMSGSRKKSRRHFAPSRHCPFPCRSSFHLLRARFLASYSQELVKFYERLYMP